MILNHVGYEEDVYSTADEYLDYLLEDIREAERLLATDPILSDDSAISKELISDFYKNRNRRMNYYAVKALEARVKEKCSHGQMLQPYLPIWITLSSMK